MQGDNGTILPSSVLPMKKLILSTVVSVGLIGSAGAQINALQDFNGSNGSYPFGAPVIIGNTIFGTTAGGGIYNNGVIYSANVDGTGFRIIYNFRGLSDGGCPMAGLVSQGNILYGTTCSLHAVTGWGGNTGFPGAYIGNGNIFSLDTNGTGFKVLHTFTGGNDGQLPNKLILVGNTLYGTAYSGGASNQGIIFSINTNGFGFQVLHTFSGADGANPDAELTFYENKLYGTTLLGGSSNCGTVFSLNTNGTGYNILYNFSGSSDGVGPASPVVISDNIIYGTTSGFTGNGWGNSSLFSMNLDGSKFAVLYSFNGIFAPNGSLVITNGIIFLTTAYNGNGMGGVFTIDTNGSDAKYIYNSRSLDFSSFSGLSISGNVIYGVDGGNCINQGHLFWLFADQRVAIANDPVFITTLSSNTNYLTAIAKAFITSPSIYGIASLQQIEAFYSSYNITNSSSIIADSVNDWLNGVYTNSVFHGLSEAIATNSTFISTLTRTITSNPSAYGILQQGPQGPIGLTGPTGATGPIGPQGPKGETGAFDPVVLMNTDFLTGLSSNPTFVATLANNPTFVSTLTSNPAIINAIAAQIASNPALANLMPKQSQTLNFPAFKVQTLSTNPVTVPLKATSSGKLTNIVFTSGNDAVASVVSNSLLTINGAGSTTITASSAGSSNYISAKASQPLIVNQAVQTLKFAAIPPMTYSTFKTYTLNVTSSANLPVTYTVANTGVAIVSNNVLLLQGTGTTTVTANQAGTTVFKPASATQTLIVK